MEADSSEWLFSILQQVQLEQFYVRIRDHLQISRLSHFDYVTPEDLEKVKCYSLNLKRVYHDTYFKGQLNFSKLATAKKINIMAEYLGATPQ